jgi:hypothetical protein
MELERESGRTAGTLHKLDMIELEDGGVVVISLNKKITNCTTKEISLNKGKPRRKLTKQERKYCNFIPVKASEKHRTPLWIPVNFCTKCL